MNEKFLHSANDLNDRYPSPDIPADTAWSDMQKLLDEDDDNTIVPPPISPSGGNNGYWKYGLLLLLIGGIAVYYISNKNKIQQEQTAKHAANSLEQKVEGRKNDAVRGHDSSNSAESLVSRQHKIKYDSLGNKIILPGTISKNEQAIETIVEPDYSKNNTTSPGAKENLTFKNKEYRTRKNARVKINGGSVGENNANTARSETSRGKREINVNQKLTETEIVVSASGRKSKHPNASQSDNQKTLDGDLNIIAEKIPGSKTTNKSVEPSMLNDSILAEKNIKPLQQDATAFNKKDSIKDQQLVINKPWELKKDTTGKINNEKGQKKITWAAGLGLRQSFAVSSQQYSGYNANGTRGIIADYIPVPFIRGYLSKKLCLQLEAQFNTPQYSKQLLVKKEIILDSNGNKENSTYINKLYYFNIPLSIHYSVNNNFNIGAGIQFSHLKNAVGLFELKEPGSMGTKTTYASLKNDPLYKEIKATEWLILLNAYYQWKNLAVGIRYNQALSNFINVQISPTQVTQGKNSSVQFFVWYTLWKNKVF